MKPVTEENPEEETFVAPPLETLGSPTIRLASLPERMVGSEPMA